jgi:RimJ/RimL family protein N-acetyltransferase/aminoglycoside phosphotransferase (APT) family kinase protein
VPSRISFRPLRAGDIPLLERWQSRPHVARWWKDPADLGSLRQQYMPSVEGTDATEVFIVEVDARPTGLIQRYLLADYPGWAAAAGLPRSAAGIDYYIGDEGLTGGGLGSRAISLFVRDTLECYPEADMVVAVPQQQNQASWRALEKAGFERLWSGELASDDPSDSGPAHVYGIRRPGTAAASAGAAAACPARPGRARRAHPNRRERSPLPHELRRAPVPRGARAWVERATGHGVASVRRLPGASSTAVHVLRLTSGARVVLRRYAWPGFLEDEPTAPRREADALELASARGLPAPALLAADLAGQETRDGVPAILMTLRPGAPYAVPDLRRLAQLAAAVHDVDAAGFAHRYQPWYEGSLAGPPDEATRPNLWDTAIELWHGAVPDYREAFVHRDFHPGNVLWKRGVATGLVDWANACLGPRGCDVAHCRTNLIELGGPATADAFLEAYESVTGYQHHPYWELASVLEHGPSYWSAERVEGHEPRLEAAVRALTGRAWS